MPGECTVRRARRRRVALTCLARQCSTRDTGRVTPDSPHDATPSVSSDWTSERVDEADDPVVIQGQGAGAGPADSAATDPEAGTPEGGIPEGGIPDDGTPDDGTPEGGIPDDGTRVGDGSSATDGTAAGAPSAPEPDPVLAEAVELARAAAVEVGGADVGGHLGVSGEDPHAATHAFTATLAGYRGWHWAVTVARSPRSSVVTVDEVVLLPGDGALRAPEWVPWSQRVRAGDLGAGDLLPSDPDDARLVPAYFSDGDPSPADPADAPGVQMRTVADEIGLGRVRVLSRDGRLDAAQRWLAADLGPDAPMAKQAPARCGTCGFLVSVRGSLGAAFGICANEFSLADARVVSVEFGCGAHSEAGVEVANRAEPAGHVYDSGELVMDATDPADAPPTFGASSDSTIDSTLAEDDVTRPPERAVETAAGDEADDRR